MNSAITGMTVPKLGLTMKSGTVSAWHVQPGQAVEAGQPVFDIETEKVTTECLAERVGVLRRQVGATGATLPVGALVAVFADAQVDDAAIDVFVATFKPELQA